MKASGSSSDAASASAVFARALALGALANIAPRCARVWTPPQRAEKLVGALDALAPGARVPTRFEPRRALGARGARRRGPGVPGPGGSQLGGDSRGVRQPRARVRAAAQGGTCSRRATPDKAHDGFGGFGGKRRASRRRAGTFLRRELRGDARGPARQPPPHTRASGREDRGVERVRHRRARDGDGRARAASLFERNTRKAWFGSNRRRSRTRRPQTLRGRSSRRWRGAWWWSRRGSGGTRRPSRGGCWGRRWGRRCDA